MAEPFSGQAAIDYLTARGYNPAQAAAIAGHMQQESGFNPGALNKGEGAFGLLQWRLDRRQALEDFAKSRGAPVTDPTTQIDFIGHEMGGSEARNAGPFMSATDLPTASAALKRYIRFGDNSDATRLANAQGFLGGTAPQMAAAAAPAAPGMLGPAATPDAQAPAAQQSGMLAGLLGGARGQAPGGAGLSQLGMSLMAPKMKPMSADDIPMPMPRRHVDTTSLQAMLQQPRFGAFSWS